MMTRTTQQRIMALVHEFNPNADDDTPMSQVMVGFGEHYDFIMRLTDIIGDVSDDDVEACQTVGDVVKLGER